MTHLVKAFKDLTRSQKQRSVLNYKDVGTTYITSMFLNLHLKSFCDENII